MTCSKTEVKEPGYIERLITWWRRDNHREDGSWEEKEPDWQVEGLKDDSGMPTSVSGPKRGRNQEWKKGRVTGGGEQDGERGCYAHP